MTKSVPKKWTSSILRNWSTERLSNGPGAEIPALLMTASRRPNSRTAVFTISAASSSEATEAWHATASPPASAISRTTSSAGARDEPAPSMPAPLSATTTCAPLAASSNAWHRPIPRPAPVRTTARSSNRSSVNACPTARRTARVAMSASGTPCHGYVGRRHWDPAADWATGRVRG